MLCFLKTEKYEIRRKTKNTRKLKNKRKVQKEKKPRAEKRTTRNKQRRKRRKGETLNQIMSREETQLVETDSGVGIHKNSYRKKAQKEKQRKKEFFFEVSFE